MKEELGKDDKEEYPDEERVNTEENFKIKSYSDSSSD